MYNGQTCLFFFPVYSPPLALSASGKLRSLVLLCCDQLNFDTHPGLRFFAYKFLTSRHQSECKALLYFMNTKLANGSGYPDPETANTGMFHSTDPRCISCTKQ